MFDLCCNPIKFATTSIAMASDNTVEYRPIKATTLKRLFTLVTNRLRVCELGSRSWRSKLPICRNFTIKHGKNNLTEAHTMVFIAQNTLIPVPKVYCAFSRKGQDYILMQRIPGNMLVSGGPSRSNESRSAILQQLKNMIAQLRTISPQMPLGVVNVLGGPIFNYRLPLHNLHGPFASIEDFHLYLRNSYNSEHPLAVQHNELLEKHHGDWPICFTY